MQSDLKLRFGISIGLIDLITFPASCRRDPTFRFDTVDRQFAPFFEQRPFVSMQLSSIHFPSYMGHEWKKLSREATFYTARWQLIQGLRDVIQRLHGVTPAAHLSGF